MDDIPRWAASVGTIGIAGGPKSARTGWALLFNCFRRHARETSAGSRAFSGSPHGLAPGWSAGSRRFTSQKNVFAPKFKTLFGSLKTIFQAVDAANE